MLSDEFEKRRIDLRGPSSKSRSNSILKITSNHVLSISGINIVKLILLKHIEVMILCQSNVFELFVSCSNLMRFYQFIAFNTFVGPHQYESLMQDVIMFCHETVIDTKNDPQQRKSKVVWCRGSERARVNKTLQFQQRNEKLKQEIIQMQGYVESNYQNMSRQPAPDRFQVIYGNSSGQARQMQEGSARNLMCAFGLQNCQPGEEMQCHLIRLQQQLSQISQGAEHTKIELILKSIIALEQIDFIHLSLEDIPISSQQGGIKALMKELLSGNMQHMTYLLNYFKQSGRTQKQIERLVLRNNVRMLLMGSSEADQGANGNQNNQAGAGGQQEKRNREFDHIIITSCTQIGQTLRDTISNIPYCIGWASLPQPKSDTSSYALKICEQAK